MMASSLTTQLSVLVFLCTLSGWCYWCISGRPSPPVSASSNTSGISLQLFPPYSPKSPHYIAPNVSFAEKIQLIAQRSNQRAMYLYGKFHISSSSNSSSYNKQQYASSLETVTPIIERLPLAAMVVQVGIGSFGNGPDASHLSYLLTFDTGSATTWLQCEDCREPGNHCFLQDGHPFPNHQSSTYQPHVPQETYVEVYADGSNSTGEYATETFTFYSQETVDPPHQVSVPNLRFGCGIKNYHHADTFTTSKIDGILGMAIADGSFSKQLSQIYGPKFSYCLVPPTVYLFPAPDLPLSLGPQMYLRFGTDIVEPEPAQGFSNIPFFTPQGFFAYFVNLKGVGLNGRRLDIDPAVFAPPPDSGRVGGFAVDSGSEFSYIFPDAYSVLNKEMEDYFSQFQEFQKVPNTGDLLCYVKHNSDGYTNNVIPVVTYYFDDNVGMELRREGTFFRTDIQGIAETFCLAIQPGEVNILGAINQVGFKMIYDLNNGRLSFGKVDCETEG